MSALQGRNQLKTVSRKKTQEAKINYKLAYDAFHKTQLDTTYLQNNLSLLAQAKDDIKKAIELTPSDGDSLNLLARIELETGNFQSAQQAIFLALAESAENGGYWYSAGHIYLAQQDLENAKQAFKNAIKFAPKETRAEVSLAYTLAQDGEIIEAFGQYRELAKTQGNDLHIRSQVVDLASQIKADFYDPELEQDLISYLKWDKVNLNQLGSLVCSLLEFKFHLNSQGSATDFDGIANSTLFISALRNTLIKSELIEKLIMALRHELLTHSTQQGQLSKNHISLCQAIAFYGLRNEYILPNTDAEIEMVSALRSIADQSLSQFGCKALDISGALLLLSMYETWQGLSEFNTLMNFKDNSWPEVTYEIKKCHDKYYKISHYEFDSLTGIPTVKESKVKNQYEKYPYPRWDTLDYKKNVNYGIALRHEFKYADLPNYLYEKNLKILIAGCGTGRHALNVAKYFDDVDVLAIDISQNSLAYAKHKAIEFDINNIQFKLADLTKLPVLQDKFSIIECSGVLHHIRYYKKALSNLLLNLKPNGLIKISLYSARSRESVNQIRETYDIEKSARNEHRVKVIRHAIMKSNAIENQSSITLSDDFYSLSGTIDLLFHEYEKHFTPLTIKNLCNEFQLNWLGFSNLSHKVKSDFMSFHGKKSDLLNLKQWDEFEEAYPNTFSNMFQFYCQYQPKLKLKR